MKTIIKSKRTFGVEVEFISKISQTEVADVLNRKFRSINIKGESYNHTTQEYWKVITDASVCARGEYNYGLEIVSPVLKGRKGLNQLEKIMDALDSMEETDVNVSCGIHVHVGVEDSSVKGIANIVKLYAKQSQFIDSILSPSRRAEASNGRRWAQNAYVRHGLEFGNNNKLFNMIDNVIDSAEIDYDNNLSKINSLSQFMGGRYNAVNLESYRKYGTAEFRQHGGSINADKVCNWVIFCTHLCDRAIKSNKILKSATTFNKTFNFSNQLLKFASKRAVGFGFSQFEIIEDDIQVVDSKCLNSNLILNKMSNGSFMLLNNGNILDNTMGRLRELASDLEIDFSGMNTRRLGQTLLSA